MSAKSFYLRCVSENASYRINGLDFEDHPQGGVVSKTPVDAETAEPYGTIAGWQVIAVDPELAAEIERTEAAARAAREKLLAAPTPAPVVAPTAAAPAPEAAPAPAAAEKAPEPAPAAAAASAPAKVETPPADPAAAATGPDTTTAPEGGGAKAPGAPGDMF